ncbi:MAG TPA: S8 family serine peptidase [Candidatus Thermoplasmatota archaeon]|nr:S8 family serine peptidase [Candidatus Thermoplasmatota archaeon]
MRARAIALLVPLLLAPLAAADTAPRQEYLVSFHGAVPNSLPAPFALLERFDFAGVARVEGPAHALSVLRAMPEVAWIGVDEPLTLHLASSRAAVSVGPHLWDSGYDGRGVTIAVVDSGLDASHPAFEGKVRRAVRVSSQGVVDAGEDPDGHGTHIAGVAAGTGAGSPGQQHAGMAPSASIVGIDISTSFTTTNAIRAFEWIHDHFVPLGIRVVTNSWGREKQDARYDPDDALIRASDALVRNGIVVVFSAGNRGADGAASLTVEAMNPNVITVGATDDAGSIEPYSSRGPAIDRNGNHAPWTKPDVVAPGSSITSARSTQKPGSGDAGRYYTTMSGTSMATPHVAGIAALLLQANSALTPAQVKDALVRTAIDRGARGPDSETGHGFVDATAAITLVIGEGAREIVERVPFSSAGSAKVVNGMVVANNGAPSSRASEVEIPVHVPAGTTSLSFAFRWSGAVSFSVVLTNGRETIGPWSGSTHIEADVDRKLAPGGWTILARPSGTGSVDYRLDGEALVVTHAVPKARPGVAPIALSKQPGFFEEWKARSHVLGILPASEVPLVIAGAAALCIAVVSTLWLRRRLGSPPEAQEAHWQGVVEAGEAGRR